MVILYIQTIYNNLFYLVFICDIEGFFFQRIVFAIIAIFLVENGHKKLFKRLLHFCSLSLFLACSQICFSGRMEDGHVCYNTNLEKEKSTSIIDFFFSHGMKKLKQSKIRCQRL